MIAAFVAIIPTRPAERPAPAVERLAEALRVRRQLSNEKVAAANAARMLENAVLHSQPGGEVTITVDPAGGVSVADRGCGVPSGDRERIFERFWRGNGPKAEGAGLGLAVVKETMRAHGGEVAVGDNPGGGSVFTLRFSTGEGGKLGERAGGLKPQVSW